LQSGNRNVRTIVCTVSALLAFAANSIFCRLALEDSISGGAAIDAASFSAIRLFSGAIALLILTTAFQRRLSVRAYGNWASAAMLFLYVTAFSLAYISLNAGTGALILFGAVQFTMVFGAIRSGEPPARLEWLGTGIALAGLVYLMSPGLAAPSPAGAALMMISGIAWGVYSLHGRGADNALRSTAGNFIRSLPMIAAASLLAIPFMHVSTKGIVLAVLSGSLASGAGYAIWYAALRGLTATRAAAVQLTVPVLTALGGVVFLSETVTPRLVFSSVLILGGIGLAMLHARIMQKAG